MAGLQILLALVGVPAAAWVLAFLLMQPALEQLDRQPVAGSARQGLGLRMIVHFAISGAPAIFGLILFNLARPALELIDGGSGGPVTALEPLLQWGSAAFSVASCSAIAAQNWIAHRRLRSFVGPDFGRVLPLSVIPLTATVFALASMFLLLGYVGSVLSGTPVASDSALIAATSSFQAFAVSTLAFPAAAGFSNRISDLGQRGFIRTLLILELGELPVLVGLVQAFLALGAL